MSFKFLLLALFITGAVALYVLLFQKDQAVVITDADTPPEDTLLAKRFSGSEKFKISEAKWNLYRDGNRSNLTLYVKCDEGISLSEDIFSFFQILHWELNLVEDNIEESDLIKGFKATIPDGYDESREGWVTNLYLMSHDGTDANSIEILERDGDRLLIRIQGEKTDLNFYDGSKPRTKLLVHTWFGKDGDTMRSMN